MKKQKTIAFDLDDTLCSRPPEFEHLGIEKYKHCVPIQHNIDMMNRVYDEGHTIIIYTARGMTSQKGNIPVIYEELYPITKHQLDSWGAKFHTLIMGKLHYDVLIDDKTLNPNDVEWKNKLNKLLEN